MYLSDLVINDKARLALDDLFLDKINKDELLALIREHRYVDELLKFELPVNNKVLLYGSSGCGKTTTAKAIAAALDKNMMILNLSNVICARIGESAQNLKMVFDKAARDKSVLFLDEFDQIGKARTGDDREQGEMRRLINTIIQLIDYFPDHSLLICATNHRGFIDPALLRRFQLNLSFVMPSVQVLDEYYDKLLSRFPEHMSSFDRLYGISFAQVKDFAFTRVKETLIKELEAAKRQDEVGEGAVKEH